MPLGNRFVAVSWQERDGATVTNVQDCSRGLVHSFATDGRFLRMTGTFTVTRPAARLLDERSRRDQAAPGVVMTTTRKVALIVGGARRIGLAIAERLAKEGARVFFTGRNAGVDGGANQV